MNIFKKTKKKVKTILKRLTNDNLSKYIRKNILPSTQSPSQTEFSRWKDIENIWGTKNPERAELIGSHINRLASNLNSSSLLDIGCGSMSLKDFLDPQISYFPADIHKRSPDCALIDINEDKYPKGAYDFICAIGVIEYFKFPETFFKNISSMCSYLICTYSIKENYPVKVNHWFNHYRNNEFLDIAKKFFELEDSFRLFNGQIVFIFSSKNFNNKDLNKSNESKEINQNNNEVALLQERSGWSFSNISNQFDKHVALSVPLYHESRNLAVCFSDFLIKTDSLVIDLGCSTGTFLKLLAERHANKSDLLMIGVDSVESMISKSKKQSNDSRIQYICEDIVNYELQDSAQLISAFYTLQFIHPRHRQEIINRIYRSLDWGGGFIWSEKVRATDARFQDWETDLYLEFKSENGFNNDEIRNKQLSLRGVMEPFSTTENRLMLQRAGFKDFICISKYLCFETILAVK